jgi:hypothetical protein
VSPRARAAARSSFLDIALVEPPKIVVQPLVGRADSCSEWLVSELRLPPAVAST